MYLNDAFDRELDAKERPTRPIPAGQISAEAVFAAGFGMLGGGVILLFLFDLTAGLWGLALAGTIIAYDGTTPIRTPYDHCILIMPSRRLTPGLTTVRLGQFVD